MTFAEKLLQLRKQKGISQEELAEQLKVSRQTISRWEIGTAMPDSPNLLQISKLFKVTTDYLLNDDFDTEKDIPIVKKTEDACQREHRFKMIMIIQIGVQALGFLMGIMGWILFQQEIYVFFALIINLIGLIMFESLLHRVRDDSTMKADRKKYYRISIWLFSLFPIQMIVGFIFRFYPRPILSILMGSIPMTIIYLVVCTTITIALTRSLKKS